MSYPWHLDSRSEHIKERMRKLFERNERGKKFIEDFSMQTGELEMLLA